MKTKILKGILLVVTTVTLFSFDIPQGWTSGGSDLEQYAMGIDKGAGQDGKNAATIKSIKKRVTDFGTLFQNCLPDKYLGKRVRMTGFLKTKDVSEWAGFWFRVDQKNSDSSLSFDNMHDGKSNRSVKGTTDWTKYEIVLDVPLNSSNMAYGALLVGTGQVWFDNLTFEVVDNSVPTTGAGKESLMPNNEPTNLDFEK